MNKSTKTLIALSLLLTSGQVLANPFAKVAGVTHINCSVKANDGASKIHECQGGTKEHINGNKCRFTLYDIVILEKKKKLSLSSKTQTGKPIVRSCDARKDEKGNPKKAFKDMGAKGAFTPLFLYRVNASNGKPISDELTDILINICLESKECAEAIREGKNKPEDKGEMNRV